VLLAAVFSSGTASGGRKDEELRDFKKTFVFIFAELVPEKTSGTDTQSKNLGDPGVSPEGGFPGITGSSKCDA